MKIVVLGGGISTERHVSLVTATSICKALRRNGHKAIFVDLFLGIENYEGALEDLFDAEDGLCGDVSIGHEAPDLEAVRKSRGLQSESHIGEKVLDICRLADCVVLGLHGIDGEDGKIQAALDLMRIPYTGSGQLGSAMSMNKAVTREIMQFNGIKCAPETDTPPCVVKCAHGGSSIGTYICDTEEEMKAALLDAEQFHDEIVIEKKIKGREITVPVLDGRAMAPIEIVPPKSGKFDYVSKYQGGDEAAAEICPARISPEETELVQRVAEQVHKVMRLDVYSRVDFILDDNGEAWCLEVNTLPGMTPASLIPKAAAVAGMSYDELCEKILELSLKKQPE